MVAMMNPREVAACGEYNPLEAAARALRQSHLRCNPGHMTQWEDMTREAQIAYKRDARAAIEAYVGAMTDEQASKIWYAAKVPLPHDFPLWRETCEPKLFRAALLESMEER